MKKWLYVILAIEVIATVVGFFIMLYSSLFLAIFGTAVNALSILPVVAIIYNIRDIEELRQDVAKMRYFVRRIEDKLQKDDQAFGREESVAGAAIGNWECVKCGTINKEGTNCCSNCKATYSPEYNPTDDPNKNKKVSRWVKYK